MVRGLFIKPVLGIFKKTKPAHINFDAVKLPEAREGLKQYVALFSGTSTANQQRQQVEDLMEKFVMCEDEVVVKKAEETLASLRSSNLMAFLKGKKKTNKAGQVAVTDAEFLLDSANTASGKYCTLFSYEYPFDGRSNFKKKIGNMLFDLLAKISKMPKMMNEFKLRAVENIFAEPYKKSRILKRSGEYSTAVDKAIKNEAKYASLKEYISHNLNDKEMATYLWEKYFLSHCDKGIQKQLKEIYDKFGVRILMNEKVDKAKLIYIKKEMEMWKNSLGDDAKFPELLDINKDYKILTNSISAYATKCSNSGNSRIVIPEERIVNVGFVSNTLRHEMGHVNDRKMVTGKKNRFFKKRMFKELSNAGMENKYVNYGMTQECELKAVACVGDMTKYSDWMKTRLIKKGLPEGVFNLRPVSYDKCRLLACFGENKKTEKLIEKLETVLGGNISQKVVNYLIESKCDISHIKGFLRRCPKDKQYTEEEFLNLLKQRVSTGRLDAVSSIISRQI